MMKMTSKIVALLALLLLAAVNGHAEPGLLVGQWSLVPEQLRVLVDKEIEGLRSSRQRYVQQIKWWSDTQKDICKSEALQREVQSKLDRSVESELIAVDDFPYAWYLRQVHAKITENLRVPPDRGGVVRFEISRDGSLRNLVIEKTTGDHGDDSSFLRAIELSSPFPPLPADVSKQTLRVQFRLTDPVARLAEESKCLGRRQSEGRAPYDSAIREIDKTIARLKSRPINDVASVTIDFFDNGSAAGEINLPVKGRSHVVNKWVLNGNRLLLGDEVVTIRKLTRDELEFVRSDGTVGKFKKKTAS